MKKPMFAVAVALIGSTMAHATTPEETLVQRVAKYAATAAKLSPKGTCVCQDGTTAAGYLYQSERQPGPGKIEVTVECNVPAFDVVDGAFLGTRSCDFYSVLAK